MKSGVTVRWDAEERVAKRMKGGVQFDVGQLFGGFLDSVAKPDLSFPVVPAVVLVRHVTYIRKDDLFILVWTLQFHSMLLEQSAMFNII